MATTWRRHIFRDPRVAAAGAVVTCGLAVAACGADEPAAEAVVVRAEDRGVLEAAATIRGRDGAYSGALWGRSIWLYGDTVLADPAADGRSWRHNSWSYTEDLDAEDGVGGFSEVVDAAGAPVEFFPQTEAERAFNDLHFVDDCTDEPCGARWALWPGALVADPERDRALVFYTKLYAEPGPFAFRSVGHSIAVWRGFAQAPERPVLDPAAEHPTLLFGAEVPFFGGAAVVVDSYIYAYGCGLEGFDKPCKLGRVRLADALDRDAWAFYAGGRWTADIAAAEPVFDGNDILSVAWNPYVQRYVAVYSAPMDTRVMLRTAPAPEGPWSAAVHVFTARAPTEEPGWVYDAQAHAELARDGGRVQYVTYSRATGFLAAEVRLVEVELALP